VNKMMEGREQAALIEKIAPQLAAAVAAQQGGAQGAAQQPQPQG